MRHHHELQLRERLLRGRAELWHLPPAMLEGRNRVRQGRHANLSVGRARLFGLGRSGGELRERAIGQLVVTGIRTDQCCETTTRHASDLGYSVIYAIDATLTFPMVSESGRIFSAEEIAERTQLVLAGRFAKVVKADAVHV